VGGRARTCRPPLERWSTSCSDGGLSPYRGWTGVPVHRRKARAIFVFRAACASHPGLATGARRPGCVALLAAFFATGTRSCIGQLGWGSGRRHGALGAHMWRGGERGGGGHRRSVAGSFPRIRRWACGSRGRRRDTTSTVPTPLLRGFWWGGSGAGAPGRGGGRTQAGGWSYAGGAARPRGRGAGRTPVRGGERGVGGSRPSGCTCRCGRWPGHRWMGMRPAGRPVDGRRLCSGPRTLTAYRHGPCYRFRSLLPHLLDGMAG